MSIGIYKFQKEITSKDSDDVVSTIVLRRINYNRLFTLHLQKLANSREDKEFRAQIYV